MDAASKDPRGGVLVAIPIQTPSMVLVSLLTRGNGAGVCTDAFSSVGDRIYGAYDRAHEKIDGSGANVEHDVAKQALNT